MYNYRSTILLLLPAFNLKIQEPWDFYLDGCSKLSNSYGIIIGGDLFGKLGMIMRNCWKYLKNNPEYIISDHKIPYEPEVFELKYLDDKYEHENQL